MNKTLKRNRLCLLPALMLAAVAVGPALAADYYLVVPVPGKSTPAVEIEISFNPISLPSAWVGEAAYPEFDFQTALTITGDPGLNMSLVQWSVSGSLPPGLTFSPEGRLQGIPAEAGVFNFQIRAVYKSKSANADYVVEIHERNLVDQAGARSWADGTFAQSCMEYLNPPSPYVYTGATGDGTYKIAPNGQSPFNVYCDMTSDGGGWTRVVRQTEAEPVRDWVGTNGASYALSAQQIPPHTQTAFGKDEEATFIDYVNFTYTTGDIIPAVLVTSPKTGRSFHIHRGTGQYYPWHNPEEPTLTVGSVEGGNWNNTLTFDPVGGRVPGWTFSAYQTIPYQRGYAMDEYLYGDGMNETFAWTVWVR